MENLISKIKENNGIPLYHYIRGSQAYGTAIEDVSDTDAGAVYLCPVESLIDLGINYKNQLESKSHDDVAYELNRFMRLLLKSNPTVLEALFVDKDFILYEHPIMTEIKTHRDKFITKDCFRPFLGYAYEQIAKCRGLNKRFLQEKVERRDVLDFAYTFKGQGSTKILHWLEHRGLKQKYCGLVNIPNMDCMYGVFYDWGRHFIEENVTLDMLLDAKRNTSEDESVDIVNKLKTDTTLSENDRKKLEEKFNFVLLGNMARFISEIYSMSNDPYNENFSFWYENQKPIGYKGMVGEDGKSNELRLSSVKKGAMPICKMHYDQDKYTSHCKDYKNQVEWEQNRNPQRYEENCGKMFDRKNVMHAVRLIHMGIEIAKGEGFNVNRRNIDRDFLLNIRLGNTSYEEIIEYIQNKKDEMHNLMNISTLPENIDVNFVNDLLLNIRKKQITDFLTFK